MKGYRKTLPVTKGLKPKESLPINSNYLTRALGVFCREDGIELAPTIVNPFSGLTYNWPYPILYDAQRITLLIDEGILYEVNSDWSKSKLLDITTDGIPDVVDYGKLVILATGNAVYATDVDTMLFALVPSTTMPTAGTMCNFRGQLVAGNIQSSWYDCNNAYIVWSNIGQTEFAPGEKNEAGYKDLGLGTVHRVVNLGDKSVICYCNDGVISMSPAKQTFGFTSIATVGISSKGCVAGDTYHVFISHEFHLWLLGSDGIKDLDYSAYLSVLDLTDTVISYDGILDLFYISDGTYTFIYSKYGLTQVNTHLASLTRIDETLYACTIVDSNTDVEVNFDLVDLGIAAMKSFEFAELGIASDGLVRVSADVTYQLGQKIVSSPWNTINHSGLGRIGATGNMFTLKIKAVNASLFVLKYVTVNYKLSDNRVQNQLQTIQDRSWNVS